MKITTFLILCNALLMVSFSACSNAANTTVTNSAVNSVANTSNVAVVTNVNATKPTASNSEPKTGASTVCDVTAYISDKDPKGLNVRDESSENGKIIGQIPLNKEGTNVHIISSSSNGWMMIDKATIVAAAGDKSVFDKKGWVSANLLTITTRGYDAGGVELYEGGKGSKVLTKIPEDMEVKIVGCNGKRMNVKYKNFTGWLEPDAQCDSAVTRCN